MRGADIDFIQSALLWRMVIYYSMLILWFVLYIAARDWLCGIWRRWFKFQPSNEQLDMLNFGGMAALAVAAQHKHIFRKGIPTVPQIRAAGPAQCAP
jgi:hypothetical protein